MAIASIIVAVAKKAAAAVITEAVKEIVKD